MEDCTQNWLYAHPPSQVTYLQYPMRIMVPKNPVPQVDGALPSRLGTQDAREIPQTSLNPTHWKQRVFLIRMKIPCLLPHILSLGSLLALAATNASAGT